jgi:hypothetical protein
MVPHVAVRKTHRRFTKFSFVTSKRFLQQYRHLTDVDSLRWPLCADSVEKVENLVDATAAMLRNVDTKLHGRSSEKRRGPSRRHMKRISSPIKFCSSSPKDFFNSIRHKRPSQLRSGAALETTLGAAATFSR